jgi:hypothetical protein
MADLTNEDYGKLSRAMNDYCFFGKEPQLEGILKMLFIAFKPNLDVSIKAKIEGKRGGAPKNNKNASKTTKNNPPCFEKTTNVNVNGDDNGDVNGNGNVNGDVNPDGEPDKNNLQSLFVSLWQGNADVFNAFSRLESPESWQAFWRQCNFSPGHIKTAVENVASAVRSGALERRFVPATPDRFVLNGWLQRGLDDFLTPEKRKEQERESRTRQELDKTDELIAEYERAKEGTTFVGSLSDIYRKMIAEKYQGKEELCT